MPPRKEIEQVDRETGEVIGAALALVYPKRNNGFGKDWFAMSQNALKVLASELHKVEDYRVLMALLARLDFDNHILVSQTEVAAELGMLRPNVARAVKRLVDLGVILKGDKAGTTRTYRLNPSFGWKGSAQSHHKERNGLTVIDGGRVD